MSRVVRISDDALSIACGADRVAAGFETAGCIVERVSSWGMHWLEPLVEIDGKGYGAATPADVAAILDGSSVKGIGVIADHPFIVGQHRLTFARAGKTRPLNLEDYEATGGWAGLNRARSLEPAQVVAEILQSGLRGRGGAGFPAAIKWKTVPAPPGINKSGVSHAASWDRGPC